MVPSWARGSLALGELTVWGSDSLVCWVLLSKLNTGNGETTWNMAPAWSQVVRGGFLEEVDC